MELAIVGGGIALAGVIIERLVELALGARETSAKKAARRFDVEYESLRELSDLLPSFTGTQGVDLEARKLRAVALAQRVRDGRASAAVEHLIVQPVGSQEWNDGIGNAVRVVGTVMCAL